MVKRPMCLLCLLLMIFLCGADWLGFPLIRGNPLPKRLQVWVEEHPEATICGEVVQSADTEYSQSVWLEHVYLIYRSEKIPMEQVKVFLKERAPVKAGAFLVVSGILERVPEKRNPGEFDSRQYYAAQHIYYNLKKGEIWKMSVGYSRYHQFLADLKERLAKGLARAAGREAGVFSAIVLGDKSALDKELQMRYQMAGIVHILAISGLHISVLGLGSYRILKRLGLGVWLSGFLTLAFMLPYGMMTGGSVSTMRAVSMFLISVGAKVLGRIYDMLSALAVAAVLLLLEAPASLCNSGFLLSFGAVLGIGVVVPILTEGFEVKRPVCRTLLASVCVQLVTLPVSLAFFGEVSLAGVFLNLLVLPTVGVVLASGTAAALLGLVSTPAAAVAALPGRLLLKIYEQLCILAGKLSFCTWTGGAPGWAAVVLYYFLLAAALLWVYWGKRRLRRAVLAAPAVLALVAGIFALGYHPVRALTITCLDVGQGDGIVVESPQGARFLIDGGSSNKSSVGKYQLLPFLKSRGISRLDGILVSHTDEDHISGVRELLEFAAKDLTTLEIGELILPEWETPPEAYGELCELAVRAGIPVEKAAAGEQLSLGGMTFVVLSPEPGAAGADVNEEGMVLELRYGAFRGLFTGDIGEETEERLLREGLLSDVDFLKVGHHGSRYSTGEAFLETVCPELAVISVSSTNTYGHPHPDTIERLEEAGAQVWCTKDYGAVTVTVSGGTCRAEGFLDSHS